MSEPAILLNRSYDDSIASSNLQGNPLVLGEILFKSYATSSNPTAEVLSSTTDSGAGHVVSLNALSATISLTLGTITVPRGGRVRVAFRAGQVSSASASGVMAFSIQKNAAALTNPCVTKFLQPAVTNNFMSGGNEQVVSCVAGDVFRVVVTGTTGGIITLEEGLFSVQMVADAAPMGFTRA